MAVDSYDVAVVGGGLVGVATAWGLAREGLKVAVLDEGDRDVRASRGNFALVWVQSKGLGLAPYAGWTIRSSNAWGGFSDLLKQETGFDVCFQRPGGFTLALSEKELENRAATLKRLREQPGMVDYKIELMGREQVRQMLPDIGPDVVGGSFCELDGHVNSLRLFRTLHKAIAERGVAYLPSHKVENITREGGEFQLHTPQGTIAAGKVALAAGNATLRQTDEGTVMIGDSKEESTDPSGLTLGVSATEASRAVRMFPLLKSANVVRTWSAIRVMTRDGFPIYDESESHPGAFTVCCHSGVTLAANHALTVAPMIARGKLDTSLVAPFSARRFHVQAAG